MVMRTATYLAPNTIGSLRSRFWSLLFLDAGSTCSSLQGGCLDFQAAQSLFFRAIKLTGPFVTMIFSMITGDMFTFSIIYIIFLFGFSQAFYFIMKSVDDEGLYSTYHTTWVALFHMTLGEYEVTVQHFRTLYITFCLFSTKISARVLIKRWQRPSLSFSKSSFPSCCSTC